MKHNNQITRREFIRLAGSAAAVGVAAMYLPRFSSSARASGETKEYFIRNISAPLYANPAMIKTGDGFTVRTKTAQCTVKSALLRSAEGKPYELSLKTAESGLTAVNRDVPPGLYDLEALIEDAEGARTEIQKKSVAVFSEFKKSFDFVFFSDVHFGGTKTRRVDVSEPNIYHSRRWGLSEIGKYNPEFILLGGDLALYPEAYHFAYPESFAFLTYYLNRPVHIIPGNHDVYHKDVPELGKHVRGPEYWEQYYGPLYHSFDYGNLHFAGLNTQDWPEKYLNWGSQEATWGGTLLNAGISSGQFEWMKSDIENAVSRASEIVAFTHIPLTWTISGTRKGMPSVILPGVTLEKMKNLFESAGVRYVFSGHVHQSQDHRISDKIEEKVIRNLGGKFVETDSAGFCVIHVENGRIAEIRRIDMPA